MRLPLSASRLVSTVIALLLLGGTAVAQSNAVVVVDPAIAAIGFAAGDVRTALQAKGTTVRTAAPNELSRQTAAVQIVITESSGLLSRSAITSITHCSPACAWNR